MSINLKLKLILFVLAAIIIGMFLETFLSTRQQSDDALMINMAGRQRMLIQKMTKELYSHLLVLKETGKTNTNIVERVRNTEKVFDITLNSLINSGKAPTGVNLSSTKYNTITAAEGDAAVQLAMVNDLWKQFKPVVNNILTGNYSDQDIDWLDKNNLTLLKEMNKAVTIMQADSEKRVDSLLIIQGVLVIFGLICSLAACFIIQSILTRIARILSFSDRFGGGNLTVTSGIIGEDELGRIGKSLDSMAKKLRQIITGMGKNSSQLNQNSEQLLGVATQVSGNSSDVSEKSQSVAAAASQMSGNMSSVAAAVEETATNVSIMAGAVGEMNTTIGKITSDTENARSITEDAVQQSTRASERVNELGEAAAKIGKVTETITEISEQTNLLALNATIEAARAGEAGKGFAVVANEIKELAKQTAEATMDIRENIESIQSSTTVTVTEISGIADIVKEVNEIVTSIAAALEEQAATTTEISENVNQASIGIQEVTENVAQSSVAAGAVAGNISEVSDKSVTIKSSSTELAKTAQQLNHLAAELAQVVKKFTV